MSIIEAGVPAAVDLNTWQSFDDPTSTGGGLWYCNASLPVTGDGVLDQWTIDVIYSGVAGDLAQFAVIRCSSGGGGGGPALSGCTRVGLGPLQAISGNVLQTFSLAGSTQLDGATPDPTGIVVQVGDIICADAQQFGIGGDCNGSSVGGGCPGPDFDTQYQFDIEFVPQPFATLDSHTDAVLMIKASGPVVPLFFDGFESGDLSAWSAAVP